MTDTGTWRKVLLIVAPSKSVNIPPGVEVIHTEPPMVNKWLVEVASQYAATFLSEGPSASLEIVVDLPNVAVLKVPE